MIDQEETNPELQRQSKLPMPETTLETKRHYARGRYTFTMIILFFIYVALALIYFFFTNEFFYFANMGTKLFTSTQPIQESSVERFWSLHAIGLAFLLAMISLFSAQTPYKKGLPFLHFLTKVAMALGFIYFFYTDKPLFIYCLGAGMEIMIAVTLLWHMIRVGTERP